MISKNTYQLIKQIHLYSALTTTALFIMYIVTSYMMIYHIKIGEPTKESVTIAVTPAEVSDENWQSFISKNKVSGRLTKERSNQNGDLVRTYSSAKGSTEITLMNGKNTVEIVATELRTSGKIIGLHRLRGYGGSLKYNLYAFLLDIVGISLILFSVTGAILWLKLLNHNKIAWSIFASGFIYTGAIVVYLMYF